MPNRDSRIGHLWLDFSDTIVTVAREEHDKLRYTTYAAVVGKPVTPELIREFEDLWVRSGNSNSAAFHSLGLPSDYWSDRVTGVDPALLYPLADPAIPDILRELKAIVPLSLFSNVHAERILPALGIDPRIFVHVLTGTEPKPALDGYREIITRSNLPPDQILYVGDDIVKDVRPAKAVGIRAGLMWKKSDEADYCFETFGSILDLFRRRR